MADKDSEIKLTDEQLDLLAASFLPVIRAFYASEEGKKFWEDHLREMEADTKAKEGTD